MDISVACCNASKHYSDLVITELDVPRRYILGQDTVRHVEPNKFYKEDMIREENMRQNHTISGGVDHRWALSDISCVTVGQSDPDIVDDERVTGSVGSVREVLEVEDAICITTSNF